MVRDGSVVIHWVVLGVKPGMRWVYPCLCEVAPCPGRAGRESAAVRTLRAAAGGFLRSGPGRAGGSPYACVLPRSSETTAATRQAAMAKPKAAARLSPNPGR
jgi:hypothetical protein